MKAGSVAPTQQIYTGGWGGYGLGAEKKECLFDFLELILRLCRSARSYTS
jgi:hypothetical protein